MALAKVFVTLKPAVLDPQGRVVQESLRALGFAQVRSVRMGKYMEIRLDGASSQEMRKAVQSMCEKLLANPVIENYRFQIEPEEEP